MDILKGSDGRLLIQCLRKWRLGEEGKALAGNKLQGLEVLKTKEQSNVRGCELFELLLSLSGVTGGGITEGRFGKP